jgi:hypothetical protein
LTLHYSSDRLGSPDLLARSRAIFGLGQLCSSHGAPMNESTCAANYAELDECARLQAGTLAVWIIDPVGATLL